mmetsp:Transcript_9299/g.20690  ORF Transcript_9299/g.20690 Transcript_9299/m.20690 type:complete len:223 (-) Transcript_9299:237-905(-)
MFETGARTSIVVREPRIVHVGHKISDLLGGKIPLDQNIMNVAHVRSVVHEVQEPVHFPLLLRGRSLSLVRLALVVVEQRQVCMGQLIELRGLDVLEQGFCRAVNNRAAIGAQGVPVRLALQAELNVLSWNKSVGLFHLPEAFDHFRQRIRLVASRHVHVRPLCLAGRRLRWAKRPRCFHFLFASIFWLADQLCNCLDPCRELIQRGVGVGLSTIKAACLLQG